MSDWQAYYKNTENRQPSELLLEALSFVTNPATALDLGAGALVESNYLLSQGFEVTAVDQEKYAQHPTNPKFHFEQKSFSDYQFPVNYFDLIHARYSLPFHGRKNFLTLWGNITAALKPGGIFVGQLFGTHDEWNTAESQLAFHTKEEVEQLLTGLKVLKLEEVDKDGTTADGSPKHWHVFHIIGRQV